MKKLQFDILYLLNKYDCWDTTFFSQKLFISVEEVSQICNFLVEHNYIKDGKLTQKGKNLLKEHKIDNAVILAAGMSTRFVPLNFEKPKSLLLVKGEVLIERQIVQLREVGIKEIIIVVGYLAEQFEYLIKKYGVLLINTNEFKSRNNHASIYAARKYLKNTIVISADLYFVNNIYQNYFYDSYYCAVYMQGKTAERGIETDEDDKIINTFYGDRCYDIWVTLGYAVFSKSFSHKIIKILDGEYNKPDTVGKFWADIQDEHLQDLYMYVKRCESNMIYEFDSLEELRQFDEKYLNESGSLIMQKICYMLAIQEKDITTIESVKGLKESMFKFCCKGDTYICDTIPDSKEKIVYFGRVYYECRDAIKSDIKLFQMDKNIKIGNNYQIDSAEELNQLYSISKNFKEYQNRSLPLCAAENVISTFSNLPLSFGIQERYIMNNTYSFNMEDNFIGCEKLFPYYKKISEVCKRLFHARYTDPRPFTGMHCIDMITKTVCIEGEKIMILAKEYGGHSSVKPVVERLGLKTYFAPYSLADNDLDYEKLNQIVKENEIRYILLAPSDIIKPLDVEKIDTKECILLYDCSQIMGIIAAGLCPNPLDTMDNIILFGGTHKTFPGPASGLIMTNNKYLHNKMETQINPMYLRHSQMHQKASLLFSLIEFEQFGASYMSHMIHCANYLGNRLREKGFDIADIQGKVSATHQIFIRCSKEEMETIYGNAYKYEVTLNKKKKELFLGYGIRLGTQEIARYDWNDAALDIISDIIRELSMKEVKFLRIKELKKSLPMKKIHYTFSDKVLQRFQNLILDT